MPEEEKGKGWLPLNLRGNISPEEEGGKFIPSGERNAPFR